MSDKLNIDVFHVESKSNSHPLNTSSTKVRLIFWYSASMADSFTQELYRRRALIIAFGSTISLDGKDDRRSKNHVSVVS